MIQNPEVTIETVEEDWTLSLTPEAQKECDDEDYADGGK